MATFSLEREVKLEVPPDFEVPSLAELVPDGGSIETSVEKLRSDYFDTADRSLLRARMTLRRRTGTTDTGWQLKVPSKPFREEIHVAATGEQVPEELAALLKGVGSNQPFAHLATVTTTRSVTRLVDAAGTALAEVDDDAVRAWATGKASQATVWREVEIELADGPLPLLKALSKRLRGAGAAESPSVSKLGRALNLPPVGGDAETVGDVLSAYLREQQLVLLAGDLALRRGNAEAVHKTRVATRRFRSTLRVFAAAFSERSAAALDGELAWFAGLLGEVRDRQVLRARLSALAAEEFPEAAAAIETVLLDEQSAAWESLLTALSSDRYLAMLGSVEGFVRGDTLARYARKDADAVAKPIREAERRVARRLRKANRRGDIVMLHQARKAAKRARYAAEAGSLVLGSSAAVEAKKYQALQDLLGEHQDSVVSAGVLKRLGNEGEHGYAFGVLHERELANARHYRREARRVARTLG